jgi:hypothetical protein
MSYFYDSHCHMMNLSHPNLTAIIKRIYFEVIRPLLLKYLKFILLVPVVLWLLIKFAFSLTYLEAFYKLSLITGGFLIVMLLVFSIPAIRKCMVKLMKKKLSKVMNLLAIMETDIGDCFIQMEEDLRKNIAMNDGLIISGNSDKNVYDKIVLTPLIMDFNLKDDGHSTLPYKVRWKPIVAQVEDLCIGIRDYYVHRDDYITPLYGDIEPLFQIIPFMGINTKNYDMKGLARRDGISILLEDLLEKNFGKFKDDKTPEMRRASLFAIKWKDFDGSIGSICSHYFMGIKVYPPLGFDPWPEDLTELEKVKYMYEFTIENNIPITAHCSPGGFLVNDAFKDFSSPFKWASVLENYPALRLNLAHFGGVEKPAWREKILELILEHDYKNFYTDISYQGVHKNSYDSLKKIFDRYQNDQKRRLSERVIFGTDFMINLQDIKSYSEYLSYFIEAKTFTPEEKDLMCRKNAERFLFLAE